MTATSRRLKVFSLLGCIALLAVLCEAQAAPRNKMVFVVPAPTRVAIDGDLADWDLSGAVESCYEPALAPRYCGRFAAMYDRNALYVSAHISDDSPLLNRHDPLVEPSLGWSGDSLQIRLSSDPQEHWPLKAATYDRKGSLFSSERIAHLTLWNFTERREPALTIEYGMDYHGRRVLRGKDAGIAFKEDAARSGYTVEARIPWQLLNVVGSPPKAGDRVAFVVKPIWGDQSGTKAALSYADIVNSAGFEYQNAEIWGQARFLAKGQLEAEPRPPSTRDAAQPLTLRIPVPLAASSLSAGIFDRSGMLIRSLPSMRLAPGHASNLEVGWNGLDDDGQPLDPGRYTVKWLTHEGIGQRLVTTLHNAGNPSWRNSDGTGAWGGDHGPPVAVATDTERVYLAWRLSEAGSTVIAVDPSLPSDTHSKIAKKLWGVPTVLDIGVETQALATDGTRLFVGQDGKRYGAKNDPDSPNIAGVVIWDALTGRALNFPFGKRALLVREWKGAGRNLTSIAVRGEFLYVGLEAEDSLLQMNWQTGQTVRRYAVPAPQGIAIEKSGSLIVTSGTRAARLHLETGRLETLVSGLSAPSGIALNNDGGFYVSEQGDSMQVKAFDAAGTLVRAIGIRGGRPLIGKFESGGMLNPTGVAIDREGKLWVTETDSTPRRISVWSREGRLLGDLLGPGHYATMGAADPLHPAWVNVHDSLFEVDYSTGKSRLLSTLIRQTTSPSPRADGPRHLDFRHFGGHTYVVNGGRQVEVIYLLDEKTLSAQPVAAIGRPGTAALAGLAASAFPTQDQPEAARRLAGAWQWADLNGDHRVQLDELESSASINWGLYWGSWIDNDLSIWSASQYQLGEVYHVVPEKWLPGGIPKYPPLRAQTPIFRTLGNNVFAVMPTVKRDGAYVIEQKKSAGEPAFSAWQAISRYDLAGKRIWSYRPTWTEFALEAPLFQPGLVIGAEKFIGEVALESGLEILGVNGYYGQFNLLSSEGLWIDALGKDMRSGPTPDDTAIWCENFSGFLMRNPEDKRVYLMGGETDMRIWEVTGLQEIKIDSSSIEFTPHDRVLASQANAEVPRYDAAPLEVPRISPAIDGVLDDWKMVLPTVIDAGEGRSARLYLGYDERNLYIAAEVEDSSPFSNVGTDAPMLFRSGDSVNVFLATHQDATPRRKSPAVGDVRILLAPLDNEAAAVLYRPAVEPGSPRNARTFSSPTGSLDFDSVTIMKGARISVRKTMRGYSLEAAIPLSELDFKPTRGTTTLGDIGVIFSDASGSRAVRRVYAFDRETAIVNDVPTEARLEPSRWGRLNFR